MTAHTDFVVQTRAADESLRHEVLEVRVLSFYSTCRSFNGGDES